MGVTDPRPTLIVRFADAGELYVSWRWRHLDGPGGVAVVPEAAADDALRRLHAALPDPTGPDGLRPALTTGAFTSPHAESALAQHLRQSLLPGALLRPLLDHLPTRPHVRIQPSPRTARVPWELLPVDDTRRLVECAEVSVLPPAGIVGAPGRNARRWSDTAALPVVAILDPRVPGFRADSALGSVLGRADADSPLTQRIAAYAAAGRLRPAATSPTDAFRRVDTDREWLGKALRDNASRLLYVGHVTAAAPESGESEHAALHLSCTADTIGFAAPTRAHRPLSAKDLLLGTHTLAPDPRDGARLWPMPSRVALIACESGGDLRFTEALGLVSAMLHNGAELVTACRWPLPTDAAFHRLAGAPADTRPLLDAICAVDAAHELADPVAALNAWQRGRLAAWRADPVIANSPVLWAAFATVAA